MVLSHKKATGTGTFGHVLLVRHKSPQPESAQLFAMKVLRKTKISMLHQVEHVKAERYILARVQHPFVVDLFATFQDGLNIYMLMSYVPGGELFTHLRRAQRFTPDVTRFYLSTIVLALRYLHSFNIIYRDLKPENLLLDSRGYLRLTDFGFAKVVDDRTWTLCGTPEYLAPEVIQSDGHGKAADWWACGVLCYEMLVGYPPFFDETPYGIYEKILVGDVYWPRTLDRLSKDLIRSFLNPDRSKRLGNVNNGVQDVLQHSWFRGVDWEALEQREINVCYSCIFEAVDYLLSSFRPQSFPVPPPPRMLATSSIYQYLPLRISLVFSKTMLQSPRKFAAICCHTTFQISNRPDLVPSISTTLSIYYNLSFDTHRSFHPCYFYSLQPYRYLTLIVNLIYG